ncbi:MAG: hypothetical protein R3C28_19795 [Pirellulaceae bacterium]
MPSNTNAEADGIIQAVVDESLVVDECHVPNRIDVCACGRFAR